MSEKISIKELLKGVEVEWTTLGDEDYVEIANSGRKPVKASLRLSGDNPYYGANNIQDYVEGYTHDGIYVLIAEDGSASLENYSIQYTNGKFWANNHVHVIRGTEKLNTRFLYHYLTIVNFVPYLTGGGRAKLTKGKMLEVVIPIPPLPIQSEIVRVLDNFTELTAELRARKKQYTYYRNKLLIFEDGEIEFKPLGEIFNLKNGYTPSKSKKEYWDNGTIPWFRMEDIRENGQVLNDALQQVNIDGVKSGKLFPANSIIVATSATIGEHALITVPYLSNQRFTNMSLKEKYNKKFEIKFLFYYCFLLDEWCKNNTTMSSFAAVDMNGFKKFPIPIPPLQEQQRIVDILDKFDTLTNSISEGLPKEIKLREQQYEYYRDLLLNFPEDKEVR